LLLADLVMDFARAIQAVDAAAPVEASYQPGIGPLRERRAVGLVMAHLAEADPQRYVSYQLSVVSGKVGAACGQ
jgi:hypothetical protein